MQIHANSKIITKNKLAVFVDVLILDFPEKLAKVKKIK